MSHQTPFDPAAVFSTARLPDSSFTAVCGCGGADCGRPRIDYTFLDPTARVLEHAPVAARVRTFLAQIERDPAPYMVMIADRVHDGAPAERILLISRVGPDRGPLDERLLRELAAPFWNDGDPLEVAFGARTPRAVISGPASVLVAGPAPAMLHALDPTIRHA